MSSEPISHFPVPNVPSIDVFITYRCGLRCSHCFVGENLNLKLDMDFDLFAKLVNTAHQWNTTELTFLGGEPTLYPQFIAAIDLTQQAGYKARIVTNGQQSYSSFLDKFTGTQRPFICFSIDGSCPEVHDAIRGHGSFHRLIGNIYRTKELGYRTAGIVSVSRQNAHDIVNLLDLCNTLSLEYVNVHYVTNRGFATADTVLTIEEWEEIYTEIVGTSTRLHTELRIEKTFYSHKALPLHCAVAEGKNLMFLPDGRVYMCMLFIDVPNSHSFTWTPTGLQRNTSAMSEQLLTSNRTVCSCPAMSHVNEAISKQAARENKVIQCIYQKEHLNNRDAASRRPALLTVIRDSAI